MDYKQRYEAWLNCPSIDDATKAELKEIANNDLEIKERFFCDLEFGTAGLRGVIGAGTNRINRYVVRRTTKGYAEYIKKLGREACERGVVIAHDNRRFSVAFAEETACVLAANGIRAYLFDSLRPTPELSFAVRHLKALGGVVITASHNPPQYNGYKLYDERGCQLVGEISTKVIEEIGKITDPLSVETVSREEAGDRIVVLDTSMDEAYYDAVLKVSLQPNIDKSCLKIVYSPQHGTGNIPVRTVLDRLGYDVIPVEEQCEPDTEFSKTLNPNPEVADAYVLSLEYAKRENAELVITTDPDCDRLGVAVKHGGEYVRMTGNQSAAVLLEYILSERQRQGTLPKDALMINTVVTSDIGDRICAEYGVNVEKTLTGFKFIGEKIHRHQTEGDRTFVFGYEESYGCLISDCVRDKDAVQAAMMLCEAAAHYQKQGMDLIDVLENLYVRHGFFLDALDNFTFGGLDGSEKIRALVEGLRNDPPQKAGAIDVIELEDYESVRMSEKGFPKSNVLRFLLADGSWIAIRPSGTEPKCKFYFCVIGKDRADAEAKLKEIRAAFEKNC